MPIPIHREDDENLMELGYELCCFCRVQTTWWTSIEDRKPGDQVAICQNCAARGDPEDVPTKKLWCRREHIATRPTMRQISMGTDREYPPAPVKELSDDGSKSDERIGNPLLKRGVSKKSRGDHPKATGKRSRQGSHGRVSR